MNWFKIRKLNHLERRVVNAAKYACSSFQTAGEFYDAEQLLIEAVNALRRFENKESEE